MYLVIDLHLRDGCNTESDVKNVGMESVICVQMF